MGIRAPRPCSFVRCGAMALPSRSLCAKHQADQQRARDAERGGRVERGYDTRWTKARAGFLAKHPVCVRCGAPSTVLDHIQPHRGNRILFWSRDNWQALCATCHNRKTAAEDGRWGSYANRPSSMRATTIPLIVVCGPPGAGKSTLVERLKGEHDLVLDLEELKARVSGLPLYHAEHNALVKPALRKRNWQLLELCEPGVRERRGWERAWLIAWEPRASDRRWWRDVAGASVVLVLPPIDACLRHVREDERRPLVRKLEGAQCVQTWFSEYSADPSLDLVITDARTATL